MPATTTSPSPFVDWLTGMTRALGYSRDSDLARALEVDQSIVSRWRRGSRPSVAHLVRVSKLTGTQLEPLLVLAGYVPASAVRNAELPEPPSSSLTPVERMIKDSTFPAPMKRGLHVYWDQRMREETARLTQIMDMLSGILAGATHEEVIEQVVAKILTTTLTGHVADLVRSSGRAVAHVDAEPKASPGKGSGDDREEDAQGPDAREP